MPTSVVTGGAGIDFVYHLAASRDLGWEPEGQLEEGLRRTIAALGHEAAIGSA
jgi:dTDP-D-glucose 4,6-dehydratase